MPFNVLKVRLSVLYVELSKEMFVVKMLRQKSRDLKDKTIGDKLIYIPNHDKQRLILY